MAVWKWNRIRERAALLVAEGALTNEQIAAQCKMTRQGLDAWKLLPEFRARVAEHVAAAREKLEAEILNVGVANRANRVRAYDDIWNRLRATIDARAEDARNRALDNEFVAPGAVEGLQARTEKMIGGGESAKEIVEWTLDAALLKEMRETAKQAAIEAGQWEEKTMLTITPKAYDTISPDDL